MTKYTIDELKEHHYRCNGNREDLKIYERAVSNVNAAMHREN